MTVGTRANPLLAMLGIISLTLSAAIASPPVAIDGCFKDWGIHVPLVVDASDSDGVPAQVRIQDVRHDDDFLYLLLDVGRPLTLQRMAGRLSIYIDADGDQSTGAARHDLRGADFAVDFSPIFRVDSRRDQERTGRGVAVRDFTENNANDDDRALPPTRDSVRSPYDFGIVFAPTYASRYFEIAIARQRAFEGETTIADDVEIAMQAVYRTFETPTVHTDRVRSYVVCTSNRANRPLSEIDIRKPAKADLRMVSWNVDHARRFDAPEVFARVLKSLDPDVILLQELTEHHSTDQLAAWLDEYLPVDGRNTTGWHIAFGLNRGNFRCAVASRLPLVTHDSLLRVERFDRPDFHVRAAGALLDIGANDGGGRLLIVSLHLKCCGGAGTFEDDIRRHELNALKRVLHETFASHDVDGVVVGGDFNLVGSGHLLWNFASGLSPAGQNLVVADLPRPDLRFNQTWRDSEQLFVPGRLDFMLFCPARLERVGGFTFHPNETSVDLHRGLGVTGADLESASDHLPIVLDLRWR